jgi:hypothetical protein
MDKRQALARKRKPKKRPVAKRQPSTPPTEAEAIDIASRAGSLVELRVLWRNTGEMGLLTEPVREAMQQRAALLKRLQQDWSTQSS